MKYPEEDRYYLLKYTRKTNPNKSYRFAKVCVVVPKFNQVVVSGAVRMKGGIKYVLGEWPLSNEEFWRNYRDNPFQLTK